MLRILTWNILAPGWFDNYQSTYGLKIKGHDKLKFHKMRLENTIKTIQILNPDILCLQEVTKNTLKVIKEKLGYKTYYSFISNGNIAKEGIATLYNPCSDTKIVKTIKFIDSENEPNVYTFAKKNKKMYLILNVHLPRGGKTFRSLDYTINYKGDRSGKLQRAIKNTKLPFIICGDFNSSDRITGKIVKKYKKYYWAQSTTKDYKLYEKMLKKYKMVDISKGVKYYTTKKVNNIKDHEDHIFLRKGMKGKLYYGDYIKSFNKGKIDQGERGLLHFAPNIKRNNWNKTKKMLTSDHRWMFVIVKEN
jgi:exonuclease III